MELDKDLASVQEVRNLIAAAKNAQAELARLNQRQVDAIVLAMTEAAEKNAEWLAKLAVEDTGFGVVRDKVTKNRFASRTVYESIREVKSIGIIREDAEKQLWEAAVPVGVVAGLVPSTNPTSTTIFKSLISVKAGNAIVFSPHPSATRCIAQTVRILSEAACAAGAPQGLLGVMTLPTLPGTQELMKRANLILATGGTAMVRAAYSSGTPALGVGPGNVPAFIERTADVPAAVRRIMASKTFDHGTICASEQAVVTEACIQSEVIAAFRAQGGYFVSGEDARRVEALIRRPGSDTVNPRIVGQSAAAIAELAGIRVPADTRVILCQQDKVGPDAPFSMEKLSPLLAFYTEENWQGACERCLELLRFGGIGHSLAIHTENREIVRAFLLQKPVSRLLINTGSTQGGIGATTGIMPSLTLGCGAVGGSATSDNVTVQHLFQIRRAAWGLMEPEAVKSQSAQTTAGDATDAKLEAIVQAVLQKLRGSGCNAQ